MTSRMENWKLKLRNYRLKCKLLAVRAGEKTYWFFKKIMDFQSKDFRTPALSMKFSNSSHPNIICFFSPKVSRGKAYSSYFLANCLEMMQKSHALFLISDKFTCLKKPKSKLIFQASCTSTYLNCPTTELI